MPPTLTLYYIIRLTVLVSVCLIGIQCLQILFPQTINLRFYETEVSAASSRFFNLDQLLTDDFPENVKKLDQENPLLHKYIKLRHLTPPSKLPYNFINGTYLNGHSFAISHLFRNKKNGTFIEAGAYDGVAASNSLYLEKALGWRGLLVECNPYSIPELKMKRRKAWIADVCLSPTKYPAKLEFFNPIKWGPSARLGKPIDLTSYGINTNWTSFEVEAMPLFAILSALNLTEIDFFSLDVEGAEFDILKTIPFDKVTIKVLDVEVLFFTPEVRLEIDQFLKKKGFRLLKSVSDDRFYVHSSFLI